MMRTVIAGDMEVGLSLGKEGMGDKMRACKLGLEEGLGGGMDG